MNPLTPMPCPEAFWWWQYDTVAEPLLRNQRAVAELARAHAGLTLAQAPCGLVEIIGAATSAQVWLYNDTETLETDVAAGSHDNAIATRIVENDGAVSEPE